MNSVPLGLSHNDRCVDTIRSAQLGLAKGVDWARHAGGRTQGKCLLVMNSSEIMLSCRHTFYQGSGKETQWGLSPFSHLQFEGPNQLLSFQTFRFFLRFGFFPHWEKSKWTPSETKCVTSNHMRMSSQLTGTIKSKNMKKLLCSGLLENLHPFHSYLLALYIPLHIYSILLHPRILSIHGYENFLFIWNL